MSIEEWRFGITNDEDEIEVVRFHYVLGLDRAHAQERLEALFPCSEIREAKLTTSLDFSNN